MRSKWVTMFAGVVAAVVLVSVAIGLSSPDGAVDDDGRTTPSGAKVTASPRTPTAEFNAARAPKSVRGTWPGRPAAATTRGSKVDWCPAVRTTRASEAVRIFGRKAVDQAACTAVRFIFDKRYSRLAIPRKSYRPKDLDFVLPALTVTTAAAYRPRVDRFVARPGSADAREALGVVVLRGERTSGGRHTSAGKGRVFYGKAFSTNGYRGRAPWINPTWSKVAISVDYSKSEPRIVAELEASAAVPVFHAAKRRHDMLTVPTRAMFFLRRAGTGWKIGGWDITSGRYDYARLTLR